MAPVDASAWAQIDDIARQALLTHLSARKFVDVVGPFGIGHACVPLGRLQVPAGQKHPSGLQYGIHQVQPLIETRIPFTIDQWELDNIVRGAKDVQLDSLLAAARDIADFEEQAIYKGFAPGNLPGIAASIERDPIPLALDVHAITDAISEGQTQLIAAGVEGISALVVNPTVWKFMARNTQGGTLRELVQRQIGGQVIYSSTVNGALLVSQRGGDLELTLGQDLSIGYKSHDAQAIHFYLTESFTFRVIAPEALVAFAVA